MDREKYKPFSSVHLLSRIQNWLKKHYPLKILARGLQWDLRGIYGSLSVGTRIALILAQISEKGSILGAAKKIAIMALSANGLSFLAQCWQLDQSIFRWCVYHSALLLPTRGCCLSLDSGPRLWQFFPWCSQSEKRCPTRFTETMSSGLHLSGAVSFFPENSFKMIFPASFFP